MSGGADLRAAIGDKLVLATHNKGKIAEFDTLLAPLGITVVSAGALGLPEPEETGTTFAANAALKAEAATAATGLPALADDSGLTVDALGGDPGIYSARWAGPDKDFAHAMQRVLDGLAAAGATAPDQRRGAFVACLALSLPSRATTLIEGRCEGVIAGAPRGTGGFGYDPLFVPDDGDGRTFGEMDSAEKHGGPTPLSHRARAVAMFKDRLGVANAT
ncbi:RdgB/HAM1 family non-canonical purine NTP pyrophosphatase [Acuticoccus sp. I52.16.1]|uniref:RdgB/HAM1 family non-canonical purine NTP pyrophosphatase n=1 Tax=Acuticoccus sp. I52.16.1 TaxID=2928472 RepID=UPI001FD1993D|nr:RdgB/HAM1 family non-canonical purine NTP pyrophosphatase [Acuticoccus sp. I52.16.1]UOM36523.1 RdgB/HAM1 family non-canonical purine NTP pyrophosphatase [Acuticoccus sp. I52.16.1]